MRSHFFLPPMSRTTTASSSSSSAPPRSTATRLRSGRMLLAPEAARAAAEASAAERRTSPAKRVCRAPPNGRVILAAERASAASRLSLLPRDISEFLIKPLLPVLAGRFSGGESARRLVASLGVRGANALASPQGIVCTEREAFVADSGCGAVRCRHDDGRGKILRAFFFFFLVDFVFNQSMLAAITAW